MRNTFRLLLISWALLVGCGARAGKKAPASSMVAIKTLTELHQAIAPMTLAGAVVERNANASQWGGQRVLLRLEDGTFLALPDSPAIRSRAGDTVQMTGRIRATLQAESLLQPVEGETEAPVVSLGLDEVEICPPKGCGAPALDTKLALQQQLMRQPVRLDGTLHKGMTPEGDAIHVLGIEGAFVVVEVVAEAARELESLVGKHVQGTGTMRLRDEPSYFVTVDGTEYPLQGGWFLAQPSWTQP